MTCHGARYNKEALEIHYRGKNIADVLSLTVEDAYVFFRDVSAISEKLNVLRDVGLWIFTPWTTSNTTLWR
jgi:excinuclease ABC subunit A